MAAEAVLIEALCMIEWLNKRSAPDFVLLSASSSNGFSFARRTRRSAHHPQHLFSYNRRDRKEKEMMDLPPASPHAPRLADLLIRASAIYSMAQHRAVY